MTELIYKELSYQLTGFAFEIDNIIGFGQNEKSHADALEVLLRKNNLKYQREFYFPIKIEEQVIKKHFFDFLIEDKIIVELKANDANFKQVCAQVFQYLKSSGKKLGLVYRFSKNGVRTKRIPNYY